MESIGEIVNFDAISKKYSCKLEIVKKHEQMIREKLDVLRKDEEKNKGLIFSTFKKLRETKDVRDIYEKLEDRLFSMREELMEEFESRKVYEDDLYEKLFP